MNGEFVWFAYGALIVLIGGYGLYLATLARRLKDNE
jgi:hypothetical protein